MTKGFYDFNIILTLELIIINFKKKVAQKFVSFIYFYYLILCKQKETTL